MTLLRDAGYVVRQLEQMGIPDLMVLGAGRIWLLEVKSPPGVRGGLSKSGQSLREAQELFRLVAKTAGVTVHVVTSPEQALSIVREPVKAWEER